MCSLLYISTEIATRSEHINNLSKATGVAIRLATTPSRALLPDVV
jgi:hypothetical protein